MPLVQNNLLKALGKPNAGRMNETWDAVVIGGSVAGLSAALMLGRSRRRTLVIDAGSPRNRFAPHMQAVLGHDGIAPAELIARGRGEAATYGVEFVQATVVLIEDADSAVRITDADGGVVLARSVVVATGLRDELPPIPGLAEGWGRTVLHCPYCHGWEVAGQRLGILATSPANLHQAELARQLSDDVTVFDTEASLDPVAIDRLASRDVRVIQGAVIRVQNDDALTVDTEGGRYILDALFTGGEPMLDLEFADGMGLDRADQPGAPLVADPRGATTHPRIFAAGNAIAPYANVPVSLGSGSMAGAGANAMLVTEDFDRAQSEPHADSK